MQSIPARTKLHRVTDYGKTIEWNRFADKLSLAERSFAKMERKTAKEDTTLDAKATSTSAGRRFVQTQKRTPR
ncbi:MAG: hypothetical protein ACPGXK_00750 [Phycisphaerae bacterium]